MDWTTVAVYALAGLVLLVVLWPTVPGARRFLKRWGVPDPTDEQVRLAIKYLRNRRLLYPPLFLLTPLVVPENWAPGMYVAVIVALLVAEAAGALRPVRGPRVASLTPRKWSDLVQRWAVVLMIALGVVATGFAVAEILAQPWLDRQIEALQPDGTWREPGRDGVTTLSEHLRGQLGEPAWPMAIAMVVLGLVAVLGIVWLTVRRTALQDTQVDAALRTRTARVAVGIGIAWMASAVALAASRVLFLRTIPAPEPVPQWLRNIPIFDLTGILMLFVGAGCWYWVANPGNRMPYVQSAR